MRAEHLEEWEKTKEAEAERKRNAPYKCEICGEGFENAQRRRDHRRYKHTKEQVAAAKPTYSTFKCELCDRGHPTKGALEKHRGRCKLAKEKVEM